jgi:hypothetical protein
MYAMWIALCLIFSVILKGNGISQKKKMKTSQIGKNGKLGDIFCVYNFFKTHT